MGRALRLLEQFRRTVAATDNAARGVVKRLRPGLFQRTVHHNGGATVSVHRLRVKSGTLEPEYGVRVGPNHVHMLVTHVDGSITDCGVSTNLLTNVGRDWWAQAWGFIPAGITLASMVSTATSSTSITDTGSVMTASNLATPQLGVAGLRVYAAPHTTTNPVVWMNAISNTTHVITGDQWWKASSSGAGATPVTGTTPTSGDAYAISHGGIAAAAFVALSTNASAASASDTVLASEVTTNGGGRVLGTYAHTYGASTLTLSVSYAFSGTLTSLHKAGLFSTASSAGADPMIYETALSADATVVNGDTGSLSWTFTLAG